MLRRLTGSVATVVCFAMIAATDARSQAPPAGPTFDVVSVKRNTASTSPSAPPDVRFNSTIRESPDGGLTMLNVPAGTLVSRAYMRPRPSVFTAIQEQLRLKLESSRAMRETLIIDRFERPTEN